MRNPFKVDNFKEFTYSKIKHFSFFKEMHENNIIIDPEECRLKDYQDHLVYNFILNNIPKGSKLLDIGGGWSRIINKFSKDYECWNIDKLKGKGNGPVKLKITGYRLVKDYIGNFNKELPNEYFDFVFSISVLEHINDKATFLNICQDIDRVLKPKGYSLHCFDIVISENTIWANKLLDFMYQYFPVINPLVPLTKLKDDPDLYVMSEKVYNQYWKPITKQPYKKYKPLTYNILWQKTISKQLEET
ncbi:MAG: methyltransferase domain-containing protein [Candidatus Scalinduaceae bacterium]